MKSPIRIAQVIGKMWAGGVEAVVFNYYRNIDKEKVQFDFFYDADSTVEPPQDLIDMGARFYKVPPYQNLYNYIKTLRKYFKMNNYNIVHSHLNTLSIFPLYAAWREGVRVRIAHNHSVPGGNELGRNIVKNTLRKGAKLFSTDYFACSEKAGRWLFGDKTYETGNVTVIKNAIDYDKFHLDKIMRERVRQELGIEKKTVVGHVGRFTFAKNHKLLIEAYSQYHKRNPESVLILVGDGELRKDIEEQINILGIKDSCILIGNVSCPEKYYQAMDVVVMPSLFEGLGIAAVEAQACKIPIVLSEAIPKEAVISNQCYYLSSKQSADEWAKKIEEVVGNPVIYTKAYEKYNIKSAAQVLTRWYCER